MKTSSITRKLTLFGCLLFFISCTPQEEALETPQSLTFETIEKGTSLEDARGSLAEEFTEFKPGSSPDMDVIILEDGRQLIFTDKVLTDKNTVEEIEKVVNTRTDGSGK